VAVRLLPDAKRGRLLAVLLLLIALLTSYLVFVHWWFVAPLLESRAELIDLRDEEARYRATAQQRAAVESRLAEVRAFEAGNPGFLTEGNFDLAASALIQRLQEQVNLLGAGERCIVVSRTPFRNRDEEPFERVTVKVRMRCEMEHFIAVLHGLEGGSPQLFVSELGITGRRGLAVRGQPAPAGYLDIAFDLYGYLRTSGGGK
jgi:general secretion pathway protein M